MRKIYFLFFILISSGISFFGCGKTVTSDEIRLGAIFDLTGPTSETGNQFAEGVKGCISYISSQGGINGRKVRLIAVDSAYVLQRDLAAYEKLVKEEKVHAIIGWSTGGTLALVPKAAEDRIPYTGVSFSKILSDPQRAPYYFMMGPTYSDQMIILLKYIKSDWKNKKGKPKVAFLFNGTEFGRSPIEDGRIFAERNGIEIVAEEVVNLDAREAMEQLNKVKEGKADYTIINETAWPTSVILKDAKKIGLKTQFLGLIYSADEKVIAFSGKDSEGYIGIFPHLFSETDIPGIKKIKEYNIKMKSGLKIIPFRYINGWITAQMMLEGIRRSGDDLSGKNIKNGFESIRAYETGGITSPFSFTEKNHVGFNKAKLGRVVNGEWNVITDYVSAD